MTTEPKNPRDLRDTLARIVALPHGPERAALVDKLAEGHGALLLALIVPDHRPAA